MVSLPTLLGAFVLAWGGTWLVRLLAPRLGLVDRPRPDRWHRRPVPRLGGVAMFLGFTVPLLLVRGGIPVPVLPLLVGGSAIFGVGLLDDLVRLENRPKLLLLILCSVVPVLLGVRFEMLPAILGAPLAIVWILGATNAFNWLDNMDGAASGIAIIAAGYLAVFAWLSGQAGIAILALLLAAAASGFLIHNFPPARVFMGDAGSGFLGFTLATLAVMGSYREVSNLLVTVLAPGLILAVPIFDTALVTFQRILNRRPLFQGGKDHPAHRLVAMGLPERKAVLLLYGLSLLAGGIALAASFVGFLAGISISIILMLVFVALGLVLSEIRVYEQLPASNGITVLPEPFWNKRWIAVMFLDVVLVSIAYVGGHLLRYEGQLPVAVADGVVMTLPLVVAAKMAGLYLAGVYRGSWRYAGGLDYLRVAQGVTVGSLAAVVGLFLWTRLAGFSRAALLLDWMLSLMLIAGSRLSLSLTREYLASQAENGRRALIFGAGRGGMLLLRELRQNALLGYHPVGFVDDDPAKRGTIIQGLAVLGSREDLPHLVRRHRIDEVLLAIPSSSSELADQLAGICTEAGVKVRKLGLTLD